MTANEHAINGQPPVLGLLSKKWMGALLVILAGVLYFETYLGLMDRWWFEDDPALYNASKAPSNPMDLFTDSRYLKSFGRGNNVVPMNMFSYWLDSRVPHFSWWTANAHNLMSMLLVMLTLHHIVYRYFRNSLLAVMVPVTWILIPSTIVVVQFTATRHYLEGFLFSLWAGIAYLNYQEKQRSRLVWMFAFLFFAAVSMLYKETYVITLPVLFGILFLFKRQYAGLLSCAGLVFAYAGYRYSMVGADVTVKQPRLDWAEYLEFLKVFPVHFSAGYAGYTFYAAFFVICIVTLWRGGWKGAVSVAVIAVLMMLNLATIYPVSRALLLTVYEPTTWYRLIFFIHTLAFMAGLYLLWRFHRAKWCGLFVGLALLVSLTGVAKTKAWWEEKTAFAEREGMFYLQHTSRLLYSESPAHWFIRGLHRFYQCPDPHHISRYRIDPVMDQYVLDRFDTIWRIQDGEYREDAALYQELVERTRLHAGVIKESE